MNGKYKNTTIRDKVKETIENCKTSIFSNEETVDKLFSEDVFISSPPESELTGDSSNKYQKSAELITQKTLSKLQSKDPAWISWALQTIVKADNDSNAKNWQINQSQFTNYLKTCNSISSSSTNMEKEGSADVNPTTSPNISLTNFEETNNNINSNGSDNNVYRNAVENAIKQYTLEQFKNSSAKYKDALDTDNIASKLKSDSFNIYKANSDKQASEFLRTYDNLTYAFLPTDLANKLSDFMYSGVPFNPLESLDLGFYTGKFYSMSSLFKSALRYRKASLKTMQAKMKESLSGAINVNAVDDLISEIQRLSNKIDEAYSIIFGYHPLNYKKQQIKEEKERAKQKNSTTVGTAEWYESQGGIYGILRNEQNQAGTGDSSTTLGSNEIRFKTSADFYDKLLNGEESTTEEDEKYRQLALELLEQAKEDFFLIVQIVNSLASTVDAVNGIPGAKSLMENSVFPSYIDQILSVFDLLTLFFSFIDKMDNPSTEVLDEFVRLLLGENTNDFQAPEWNWANFLEIARGVLYSAFMGIIEYISHFTEMVILEIIGYAIEAIEKLGVKLTGPLAALKTIMMLAQLIYNQRGFVQRVEDDLKILKYYIMANVNVALNPEEQNNVLGMDSNMTKVLTYQENALFESLLNDVSPKTTNQNLENARKILESLETTPD